MRSLTALLTAPILLAPALALAAPTFDIARFDQDVKMLADDSFEGRAPASEGEKKTIAFIEQRMKAAGLQPGGPGGRWTQDVPLLKSDIVGAPSLSLTIGGTARALTQGNEIAVRSATNGQDRVDLKNAPLVFVGYGVKAPERGWDDFKGADLKGKIMVVLVNDPDFEAKAGEAEGDFGGKTMTYYGRWTYKYEEGARQGAAGVLVIHEYAPASYGWATVKNSNTNTMFDIVRADPAAEHVPMEGWIQRDLATELFKAAGLDFETMKKAAQKKDFRPVALNAAIDASYAVKAEKIVSYNVIGRLPGKTHPDETVIYSAHWDHLGVGQPDAKGDRIYNGAKDNASGIAALLELGRAFAKQPRTDRSIVFLAVTAEEKGLLGSEYYGANPVYPLATTAGMINMDNILSSGKAKDYTISGVARLGLLDMLVAEGGKLGRTYVPDPKTETGGFYRSDHFPMAKQGVPAISFKPGIDLANGGIERGKALGEEYTRDRYHQPADEWQAGWDLTNMAPDLTLLYNTGRALADSRSWPEWSADAEFKAKRDETAAARK
ncbi:M28 family metallopeptidase [Sphingomonadaceae bacterium G21617-S1]|nr:M28 family metallopeptidase [Sphingomonadaceae bacterium G21617-S1]